LEIKAPEVLVSRAAKDVRRNRAAARCNFGGDIIRTLFLIVTYLGCFGFGG